MRTVALAVAALGALASIALAAPANAASACATVDGQRQRHGPAGERHVLHARDSLTRRAVVGRHA